MKLIPRPQPGEYAPYALEYIRRLPDDGRVLAHLRDNLEAVKTFVRSLPEEKRSTPHAFGEWTVKDILVHVADTERVVAYRALRFARQDATDLAGFDQETYVAAAGANARDIDAIVAEYTAVRMATLTLFESLDEDALARAGRANANPLSVRAAAHFIAGHELHHLHSMRENYA